MLLLAFEQVIVIRIQNDEHTSVDHRRDATSMISQWYNDIISNSLVLVFLPEVKSISLFRKS